MEKTTFAGLTVLAPGDPFSTDGFSFQDQNPTIIDRYLEVGAVGHRHDAHVALTNPTDDPVVAAVAGGGGILADTTVWACYTLIDADGGETQPSNAVAVTTPAALDPPDVGPSLALDTAAGGLLVNTYLYAVSLTDASGGETTLGPSTMIQRPPGTANARVIASGLAAMVAAAGASGWRLWRSVGGGRFGLLASGGTADYTDDGSVSVDCTMSPPNRNTTNGVNQVTVDVPNTQPVGTAQFRVYLSLDGSFAAPSVAGTYPIAGAGAALSYATIDTGPGSPPAVSRALPGANRINALTDIVNLQWQAPVADAAALPADGNTTADIRLTLDDLVAYVWDGAAWAIWSASSRWRDPVASAAALPAVGNTVGDVRITLDDFAFHVWGGDDAWHASGGGGGGGGGGTLTRSNLTLSGVGNWTGTNAFAVKDENGIVTLMSQLSYGSHTFASGDSLIASLPDGYAPVSIMIVHVAMFRTVSDALEFGDGTIQINPDGSMVWLGGIGGGATYTISLDGISFSTVYPA